jgi:hypothetical protein
MQMNYFARLPVRIRLVIVLSFLVVAIVVGILGRPSLALLVASILLFFSGGWRITRARSFVLVLILVPALVGLVLTHFDWRHPFLYRYFAGLFSVIAVLLLMDGVRIEEWIEMIRGRKARLGLSRLGPLMIGTAVGTISLSANIREQRACRKLADVYSWRAKSRTSIFLDSIALPFYNAVESDEFIEEALHRWGERDTGKVNREAVEERVPQDLIFGNSGFTARLADLNDFPRFTEAMTAVFSTLEIPGSWKEAMSKVTKPARILETGDHTGQFTRYLSAKGFDVTVLAEQSAFGNILGRLPRPDLAVNIGERSFAPVSRYSHIFLHHNSLLEAVNQLGLREVLSRLHELSSASAHVCFDYPATIMALPQGDIFCGHLDSIGVVECRYSGHEEKNGNHKALIEYTVSQEHDFCCVRVPLTFVAPKLEEIQDVAHAIGFSFSFCPMSGGFSFLAGELVFVELQK